VSRELNHRWGVGLAQRALGLIEQARGNLAEADRSLTAALETFRAMQANPYVGRCHLELASVAGTARDLETAATHRAGGPPDLQSHRRSLTTLHVQIALPRK
jgi:hypothetical protein